MIQTCQQVRLAIHMDLKAIFKRIWCTIKTHFFDWLQVYIHEQLVYSDGLASHLVYQALEEEDFSKVWKLDRLLTVQNLPRETREGTQRMGERMVHLVQSLYEVPILSIYKKGLKKNIRLVTLRLFLRWLPTILVYLNRQPFYFTYILLFPALCKTQCVESLWGRQLVRKFLDAQPVLVEAVEKIEQLDEADFGIVSPGIELSQMRHERVNIRIFMS